MADKMYRSFCFSIIVITVNYSQNTRNCNCKLSSTIWQQLVSATFVNVGQQTTSTVTLTCPVVTLFFEIPIDFTTPHFFQESSKNNILLNAEVFYLCIACNCVIKSYSSFSYQFLFWRSLFFSLKYKYFQGIFPSSSLHVSVWLPLY